MQFHMLHGNDDQLLHADIFQAHIPHFNVRLVLRQLKIILLVIFHSQLGAHTISGHK
jgi:hypothetical protein